MKIPRNLRLMYAISLLTGMVFYAPIASLYRQAAGLNLMQIALIESISYVFCLAMELPWGLLAERIGYRKTMVASCGFYFISKIVFWWAEGFGAFLLERLALSAALAGFSGVDQSILCLSCGEADGHRAFGLYDACATAGLLLASGIYAAFIGDDYRLAALATAVCYGLALILSLGLVEIQPEGARDRVAIKHFCALFRQTLRKRRFLLFLLGFALYREAVQMATVWLNQNQYLRCGMTSSGIGWAYVCVTLLTLSSAASKRLTRALGERRFMAAGFLLSAIGCVLMGFARSAWLCVACVGAVAASGALLRPLASALANRQVDSACRAAQLSIFAVLQDSVAAGADAALGRVADFKMNAALFLCAAVCLLAWACYRSFVRNQDPNA